ncbi:N-acyl-D-amino-acid deacylase [Clostridium tetanomorphum]|uniref:N-acyl-D-amino-acid deacylase family protein n=1 Tax=Clostridium tetanomorphum TaxID=1553 RepID=UPI00044FF7F9|nr:D-aminoacylase [Clostridium tetanomorphum]KAJ50797.1 D-aminoacylase Dan [Clostridium tetanomorphum DSM 665]MBP1866448.1 N-acyl-D-amino-acid deacylase [Clostridium tetanomorphum]NRS86665.1 N-acyl-D-amino-acid deacylase [Clostridium tetanomorphum]SQC01783.1 N-acyl-D-aspartate/D-glutamate deacylase [Clostridium tetanomorphum]
MNKILIKNGIIVDGTGSKRFRGDIAIENDKIANIGEIKEENFDKVIDVDGNIVCPGFIDTHSHSDLKILVDPYVEPKIRQGITTEVLGQDGISMAPLPKQYITPWRMNLAGLDGDSDELSWDWETTEGYYNLLEKSGVGPNVTYLVPHGNIRMEAMGLDNRKATEEDLKKMREITRRELEAGAAGVSTGLIYMPCAYSNTEEVIEICKVAAEFDRPLVVHQRSEADTILESMEEIIQIGKASGVKIHFSHFKVCGKKNYDKVDKVLELLDKVKEEGIQVSFDQYPYVAGSTMLGVILPPWVHDGGTDKLLKRLEDTELRKKMIEDIEKGIPGWDNFIDFAGFDGIYVTSVKTDKNKDCIGKNLVEIATMRGKDPYDATFDLLYEEENAVGMYDYYGKDEHVIKIMKRPEHNVCTDGLLGGKPHPRVYGAFPRVLGKFVREEKALTLEEAICKMTSKPASVFKLEDRGILKQGKKADIVILNEKTVIDKSTFIDPIQYPEGIYTVIVNGEIILDNKVRSKRLTGEVIRIS